MDTHKKKKVLNNFFLLITIHLIVWWSIVRDSVFLHKCKIQYKFLIFSRSLLELGCSLLHTVLPTPTSSLSLPLLVSLSLSLPPSFLILSSLISQSPLGTFKTLNLLKLPLGKGYVSLFQFWSTVPWFQLNLTLIEANQVAVLPSKFTACCE